MKFRATCDNGLPGVTPTADGAKGIVGVVVVDEAGVDALLVVVFEAGDDDFIWSENKNLVV